MPARTAAAACPDETEAAIRRAQAGDAEAFGELYDVYSPAVYRYIRSKVTAIPVAEDLTSETFVRALRRLDSYTAPGGNFIAWLMTIARNLIHDHHRSGWHRLAEVTDEIATGADLAAGPEQTTLATLDAEQLREAVAQLPEDHRECIALRYFTGLSIAETAQAMNRSEGAIKQLQWRATRRLRSALS
ncbi:sigma-70 family RNA polymerase sigma factor [Kribbella sp. NPDC051770]|uniref:sigma-70 family RNA polymerase sigma factor n=1 Tax=Kribbella sp. NPDC051770 TaxID=3155413 RepID=UPI0034366F72